MAVSYITYAANGATAASVTTVSPMSVTVWDGLLVFVHAVYSSLPTLTVTDNAAGGTNTYTLVTGPHVNASSAIVGYVYACAAAKATESLTFTVTASTGTPALRIYALQVRGHDVGTLCDASNSVSYVADESPQGAAVTATRAGIVFSYFGNTSSYTLSAWDAGWTEIVQGSRSLLARQTTAASTTYTSGVTFTTTESGLILAANVQELASDGLTGYAMEIQN